MVSCVSLSLCRGDSYLLEVVAEEQGPGDESALVALDLGVASEELDRHVRGSGGVVMSALGQ